MSGFVIFLHPSPEKKMATMSKRMRKAVAKLRTSEGVCKRVVIVGLCRETYRTCINCGCAFVFIHVCVCGCVMYECG